MKKGHLDGLKRLGPAMVYAWLVWTCVVPAGAENYNQALLDAAEKGDKGQIQLFVLVGGADVNAKSKAGGTALMVAAVQGHVEVLCLIHTEAV